LLRGFLQQWSDVVAALDRDDVCGADEARGFKCWKDRQAVPGVRPVDADPHGKHLDQLVKQHHNLNLALAVWKIEFRDDALTTPERAFGLQDISPYGYRREIEASSVPMMVWRRGDGCRFA
jgi:hypothetical protein